MNRSIGLTIVAGLAGLMIGGAPAVAAPIILNEYNAVANNNYLNGGDATMDDDGAPGKADTFFGRIEGNGRDWFEMVVVGDGTAGSTVDMRGWVIQGDDDGDLAQGLIRLSNDAYWSNVRAGTILTFHEDDTAGGGLDSDILRVDNFATLGWAWTNIYTDDATYVDTADPDHDAGFRVSNSDSQFTVLEPDGVTVVFGPAGEGVNPAGGVGSTDVFKLEEHPTALITPAGGAYAGGTSSTFGAPNVWMDGTITQDFTAFVPEPGSLLLAMVGAALAGLFAWRRRKDSPAAR